MRVIRITSLMPENTILGLFYIRGSYEERQWYVVHRRNNGIYFSIIVEKSKITTLEKLSLATIYSIEHIFKEYELSTSQVVLSRIKRYECF